MMSSPSDTFLTIGADPDLHTTPIVVAQFGCGPDRKPKLLEIVRTYVLRVPEEKRGREAAASMAHIAHLWVPHAATHFGGCVAAAAVESEQVYAGEAYKADDLICLAHVAGSLATAVSSFILDKQRITPRLPKPRDWKGQVPKSIHQARVLSRLGLKYEVAASGKNAYCVPSVKWGGDFLRTDYKHLVDALALAEWAALQHITGA